MARSDRVRAVDPKAFRSWLTRRSGAVEVRETHISWVFLAGDRAYKLKKPLVLPFLNYGTAVRRRKMCREEVRLNRRLAPEIYLGVRGIAAAGRSFELTTDGDPRAIDFVVEMRRYDEASTTAAMLERGELTRRQVVGVGRRLADFHARCAPAAGKHGARRTELELDRNVEELLAVVDQRAERVWVRALARFMTAFVSSRWDELDARSAQGLRRDCHGDLRAEHVVLGRRLSIVDCVEFDPELRQLDVADDLAFLLMDLSSRGGERFAAQLRDAYRAAGGDPGDDGLLAFFSVHRALVRAKVLLVRAAQHPPGSGARGHASAEARELLALAERFSWRARLPRAIVICGAPASGKSHLATALAEASRLPRVSSDLVRKGLARIRPSQTGSARLYSPRFNRATYSELGRRASAHAIEHGGVLIDATFRHRADREAFAATFDRTAPLLFVECVAPAAVLARRALDREHDPERTSDATLPVVLRERRAWEPLDEVPARDHILLRTDRTVELLLADLVAMLDERM